MSTSTSNYKQKDPERVRVGKTVATLRERFGYTQDSFSQDLGISRTYISLIENGTKPLPDKLLYKMSVLLELSPLAIKRFDHEPELVPA